MDHVARLHREPHIPAALMAPEVNVIRAAIAQWENAADHTTGPKPDGLCASRATCPNYNTDTVDEMAE